MDERDGEDGENGIGWREEQRERRGYEDIKERGKKNKRTNPSGDPLCLH